MRPQPHGRGRVSFAARFCARRRRGPCFAYAIRSQPCFARRLASGRAKHGYRRTARISAENDRRHRRSDGHHQDHERVSARTDPSASPIPKNRFPCRSSCSNATRGAHRQSCRHDRALPRAANRDVNAWFDHETVRESLRRKRASGLQTCHAK